MNIKQIDHIVLTVDDIETTISFYTKVLGMKAITFGKKRKALVFGDQKINLHEYGDEIEPNAFAPTPGSADLCFITTTPLLKVIEHIISCKLDIIDGPIERTGAIGPIKSIYIRDPDANLIEISNYTKTS